MDCFVGAFLAMTRRQMRPIIRALIESQRMDCFVAALLAMTRHASRQTGLAARALVIASEAIQSFAHGQWIASPLRSSQCPAADLNLIPDNG
jgi:hypothetical protein